MNQESYIPGVCNINPAEIAYRRKAMWFGFGLTAVLFVALLFVNIPNWVRALIIFVPLYIGVIGFFQVRNRFCVSYGASGKQNATAGSESAATVEDQSALNADKRKARTMNLQALLITVAVLLATLLIPQN